MRAVIVPSSHSFTDIVVPRYPRKTLTPVMVGRKAGPDLCIYVDIMKKQALVLVTGTWDAAFGRL